MNEEKGTNAVFNTSLRVTTGFGSRKALVEEERSGQQEKAERGESDAPLPDPTCRQC
jgi:hypothetical protein